jgi:putative ABC transport system permease protein
MTMLFVIAAAMLVSLAAILIVNLSGAIDTLMAQAKTSHFMQMHSGSIDLAKITVFAEQNDNVDEFQVLEFLNMEGAKFVFEQGSLADSVQDNGLSVQSEKFDFLLDLDGNVIQVSDGEIYVPLTYMQDGSTNVGDTLTINDKSFIVAGFLRDSQMNSLLASSKRFLVSKQDYAALKDFGSPEYLIEFRLKDLSTLGAFEAAYTSANLNANGVTITYPLFKMMNALSDGFMIAVILLVSVLVVAVAFICIRFTLLAKIEDDYQEIGVMKAIGIRVSDIKKLYLAKYTAVAAIGSILGYALSFAFKGMLLENIRLYMGESENQALASLIGIIGVLLVFLTIVAFVNGILNQFRTISPAEAIRFGVAHRKPGGAKKFLLSSNKLFDTNMFLGVKDVLSRKSLYATMLMILVILVIIMVIPQNLYNTMSSSDFITYMGVGKSDIRFDIQQTRNISDKAQEIAAQLEGDSDVAKFVVLTTKTFAVNLDDGSQGRIKVELGDLSVFPLTYTEGRAPTAENEIALSVLLANDLGKKVGDPLTLVKQGEAQNLTICGTYSDVTNGGKTAKAVFSDDLAETMWSVVTVDLADKSLIKSKIADYSERFEFAKVSDIEEYIDQTYGSTIQSIGMASYAAFAVALVLAALITILFMKMVVAKDRYSIAVMKSFGFTNTDIKKQYVSRAIVVLLVGVLIGTILANTLGENLAGAVISAFGASAFHFVVNPLTAYVLSPLMMAVVVLAATFIGTRSAGKINIRENIKE